MFFEKIRSRNDFDNILGSILKTLATILDTLGEIFDKKGRSRTLSKNASILGAILVAKKK